MKNLKDYAMNVLMVTEFVEKLNDTYDKDDIAFELYHLSLDELTYHRVLSIYEVVDGTCLVSIKFDKQTGELTVTDDDYVYDKFEGYTNDAGRRLLNSEDKIDLSLFMAAAYITALSFSGSKEAWEEFRAIARRALVH